MKRRLSLWKLAALGLAALLVAGYLVPMISAERYREPIHQALENALGRKVQIGGVRFRLLPFPGFTIENVEVGEDPLIGPEPAAYITTLKAVPRLSALFGGPLAFSSIDLEETSLNLTRVERDTTDVRWNFSSLLRPALLETFPSVHLHGGRINFKLGDTKSIYYLLNTDVDLWPPSTSDGSWTFRIRAEPARTDRTAHGFGSFLGGGEWKPSTRMATLDLKLEKSQFGQMLMLFAGYDTGIRGEVSGEAHLAGPLTKLGVRARLGLADVHSWELARQEQGSWPLSIGGVIDIPGEVLDLRMTADQAPLDVRYRLTEYLRRPRWGVTAYFSKLPTAPLLSIARNMGAQIPKDLRMTGIVEGGIGYSIVSGKPSFDGQIQISNTTMAMPGTPALTMEAAQIRFSQNAASMAPVAVRDELGETATLTGSYDFAADQVDLGIATEGMEIGSLRKQISLGRAPFLGQATSGSWRGSLHYTNAAQKWDGNLHLEDADIPFEAFEQPVHIRSADAAIDGSNLALKKLEISLGDIEASGEYRYENGVPRPHKFHLTASRVELQSIEQLLQPTLRRGNILTSALNFGRAPQPDWLRNMKADGTLQVEFLKLMDLEMTGLRTRVVWDGTTVKLANLQATLEDASLNGSATIDLTQRKPLYRVTGTVNGVAWRTGVLNAEGEMITSGLGSELLRNLAAKGSFRGKNLDFSPFDVYSTADGCFEWSWDPRNPRLKLTQLALASADGKYVGSGETQDDGQLLLKLSDGEKQIQAAGAIWRGASFRSVGP